VAGWHIGRQMAVVVALSAALVVAAAGVPAVGAPLPDGRLYELVSPPQKHGGDVLIDSLRTWAAEGGNAVAFSSLTGFGDVVGTGVATDYMATRVVGTPPAGSQGWTVHAITPPQGALPVSLTTSGFEPMDVAFTPSLDAGVFQSWDSLTSDPDVASVANLYLRRGFRTAPSPSVDLVTQCPACAPPGRPLEPFALKPFNMLPKIAGLSVDGTHVLFESTLRLTSDASDGTTSRRVNLYEYADGTVRNVGILPDGSPAAGAVAGQGAGAGQTLGLYMPHALSQDGTRAAFTAAPGFCQVDTEYVCGSLYLRDMSSTPGTTVQVNASERTTSPDPGGSQPAIFWAMSANGQRVFFTSNEELTNDDSNTSTDLYMFDASAPAGRRLTRISVQDPSQARSGGADVEIVLGASDDGQTVYFTSSAPLLPGDPSFGPDTTGIYVWSDAGSGSPRLSFVGPLAGFSANSIENRMAGSIWSLEQFVQSRVSPDGRFLLFSTTNGDGVLSPYGGQRDYDQGTCSDIGVSGCRELYVYDASAPARSAQQLRCVSCRPDGATATVSASDMARTLDGAASSVGILDHALSTDGRVFFSTSEALVPEDVNGRSDAYEWEGGQVHLLTDGQSASGSYFLDASPDGADVFVVTRAQLTAWDTDGSYDLYDVRQPLPDHPAGVLDPPAQPPACVPIDGCRGSSVPAPSLTAVSTVTFHGTGNLRQKFPKPLRCRTGTVRKHTSRGVRCVRRPRRKKPARCTRSRARGKQCSKAAARGSTKRSAR